MRTAHQLLREIFRCVRRLPSQVADGLAPERIDDVYHSHLYDGLSVASALGALSQKLLALSPYLDTAVIQARFESIQPDFRTALLEEAEAVCRHRIRVFGELHDFGPSIDWHADPCSTFRWPDHHSSRLDPMALAGRADIRPVWELGCFRHAVVLGQAYLMGGNPRFAEEFADQVRDWVLKNPTNFGPAWNCAMVVSIRAANLIWAAAFLACSPIWNPRFQILFLNLLRTHGRHIRRHLENVSPIRGNHYLADLVGLVCLGCILPAGKETEEWLDFAWREIDREILVQVNPDGTSFEASVPYHRLVTEMLLHAVTVHRRIGGCRFDPAAPHCEVSDGLSSDSLGALEKMCEFTLHYTRPDGCAPQIGDNDSSRWVDFGAATCREDDHRHLLAVAGELFDRDDFRRVGAPSRIEAFWMLGSCSLDVTEGENPARSHLFVNSGVCIMRAGDDYAAVRCGPLGTGGKGTHTHSDNLSLELCSGGQVFFADPGTFTYLRHPALRDLFRSTKLHNTVEIDGIEQYAPVASDAFRLQSSCEANILEWRSDPSCDKLIGRVKWVEAPGTALYHHREIIFQKESRSWTITDRITGSGMRLLEWRFHLHPTVRATIVGEMVFLNGPGDQILCLEGSLISANLVSLNDSWYSPGYGRRVLTQVLCIARQTQLPFESTLQIYRSSTHPTGAGIRSTFEPLLNSRSC